MQNYELTVKHVATNGHTSIYPTTRITRHGNSVSFPIRDDGMIVQELTDGIIYVMNGYGKTVNTFDLDPRQPQEN